MPRPTSREKTYVSLAVTALRESLHETQEEFSRRMGTSVVTVGRWETSHPPSSAKTLERLLRLARKYRHGQSIRAFETALEFKKTIRADRKRMGEILNPDNAKRAADRLASAWMANQHLIHEIVTSADPDQFLLIAAEQTKSHLLKLADLICYGGREELMGEKK